MRFPPIPSCILRSMATVKVCTNVDMYQNQTYATYTVNHVHLQPSEQIDKSKSNTDKRFPSILFVDVRHSSPALNWKALLESAHEKGGDMRVIVRNTEYTVMAADGLRDASDKLHHWEIMLS